MNSEIITSLVGQLQTALQCAEMVASTFGSDAATAHFERANAIAQCLIKDVGIDARLLGPGNETFH